MIKIITAKDLRPQDNPGDGWHMVEPHGVHPQTTSAGQDIVQVIDNDAIEAIVRNTVIPAEGIMVDNSHLSREDGNDTDAYGWAKELAGLDMGDGKLHLAAWVEYSDIGLAAVKGKRIKKWSTEYDAPEMQHLGDNKYRPTRLDGLALTNRNNNKGQIPITNREHAPLNPDHYNPPNTKPTHMQAIAEKLGLPAEASEEEILKAIQTLQDAQVEARESEAEAILNSEGLTEEVIDKEEKELLMEGLVSNRDRTINVVKKRAAELRQNGKLSGRIHNRTQAPHPGTAYLNNRKAQEQGVAANVVQRAMELKKTHPNKNYFERLYMAQQEVK